MTADPDRGQEGLGTDQGGPLRFDFFGDFGEALIALFYVGGSILFFAESTGRAGVWMFLIGSMIWLLRPVLRMAREPSRRRSGPL